VRRIEAKAFLNCAVLKSICIPALVEILGSECFSNCLSLASVSFESESQIGRAHV
jgi:hypothetical protein